MRRASAFLVFLAAVIGGAALGHFAADTKVRSFLVVEAGETPGLIVYVRTPAPLLFSDTIRAAQEAGTPLRHPLIRVEPIQGGARFRLDMAAATDPQSKMMPRLRDALTWRADGQAVRPELLAWRVLLRDPQAGFATPEAAAEALAKPQPGLDPLFGEAMVDAAYRLPDVAPGARLSVAAAYPALALPPGTALEAHLVDARMGALLTATEPGQLQTPVAFPGPPRPRLGAKLVEGLVEGLTAPLTSLPHALMALILALIPALGATRFVGHALALAGGQALGLLAADLAPSLPANMVFALALAAAAGFALWRGTQPLVITLALGLFSGLALAPTALGLAEAFAFGAGSLVALLAMLAIAWGAAQRLCRDRWRRPLLVACGLAALAATAL